MGFRSVFISEDIYASDWPDWFKEKYKKHIDFSHTAISTVYEMKLYSELMSQFFDDVKRCIPKMPTRGEIDFICLHECGGVTKVVVDSRRVHFIEPTGWAFVDEVTHYYCYGCVKPEHQKPRLVQDGEDDGS